MLFKNCCYVIFYKTISRRGCFVSRDWITLARWEYYLKALQQWGRTHGGSLRGVCWEDIADHPNRTNHLWKIVWFRPSVLWLQPRQGKARRARRECNMNGGFDEDSEIQAALTHWQNHMALLVESANKFYIRWRLLRCMIRYITLLS